MCLMCSIIKSQNNTKLTRCLGAQQSTELASMGHIPPPLLPGHAMGYFYLFLQEHLSIIYAMFAQDCSASAHGGVSLRSHLCVVIFICHSQSLSAFHCVYYNRKKSFPLDHLEFFFLITLFSTPTSPEVVVSLLLG